MPKIVFAGTAISRDQDRELERVERRRRGDRVPGGAEAVLERPPEDERDGRGEHASR